MEQKMKIFVSVCSAAALVLSLCASAGKVPVMAGQAMSLSGLTIPQGNSAAPSPATPAISSSVPSISLPASMTSANQDTSEQSTDSKSASTQPTITVAQTVNAVTSFSDTAAFSTAQASKAIALINSVLGNATLTTNQSAQLIQLREGLEQNR
jgi:hypothetical protein